MDAPITNNIPETIPVAPQSPIQSSGKEFLREIAKAMLIILVIVLPVRMYIMSPFVVSGESMSPTFESSDYLIIDKLSYHFTDPSRGDVIVFRFPGDPSIFFIKRVIGLPGETVEIKNGAVTIINETSPKGIEILEPYIQFPKDDDTMSVTLAPHEYFVMGDNRYASSDSRVWGTLDDSFISGKVMTRLLPVAHAGWLPGEASY